jgi:hypothetical protein
MLITFNNEKFYSEDTVRAMLRAADPFSDVELIIAEHTPKLNLSGLRPEQEKVAQGMVLANSQFTVSA